MARTFPTNGDFIRVPHASDIDNLDPLTICGWMYPTGWGQNSRGGMISKSNKNRVWAFNTINIDTVASFEFERHRATTFARVIAASDTLTLNTWYFLAAQFRSSGPNIQAYKGTATSLLAEVSYATQQTGAGTPGDNADQIFIGNFGGESNTFQGSLGYQYIFGAYLTLAELQSIQFGVIPAHLYNDLKRLVPLWGIGSTEPDLSGNRGNSDLIVGTAQANGPPVGKYGRRTRFYSIPAPLITALSGAQPAFGPGTLGLTESKAGFAKVTDRLTGSQPAFGPGKLAIEGSQPEFAPGVTTMIGTQAGFSKVQERLIGSLPVIGMSKLTLDSSQAAFASTKAVLLDSTPAFAPGKLGVVASQPAIVIGKLALLGSQPHFAIAKAILIGSQPAFALSSPDLPVTPNPVAQRYAPMHLIEVTV